MLLALAIVSSITGREPAWFVRRFAQLVAREVSACTLSATSSCSRLLSVSLTLGYLFNRSGWLLTIYAATGLEDLSRVTLMSDGVSVYECTNDNEVIDLLHGGQGMFAIALGGVWRDVQGSLAELA